MSKPIHIFKCSACAREQHTGFVCAKCGTGTMKDTGRKVEQDLRSSLQKTAAKWPMLSESLGVSLRQIDANGKYLGDMGRKFPHHRFDPKTGAMILNNNSEFKRALHDLGYADKNKSHVPKTGVTYFIPK